MLEKPTDGVAVCNNVGLVRFLSAGVEKFGM